MEFFPPVAVRDLGGRGVAMVEDCPEGLDSGHERRTFMRRGNPGMPCFPEPQDLSPHFPVCSILSRHAVPGWFRRQTHVCPARADTPGLSVIAGGLSEIRGPAAPVAVRRPAMAATSPA